MRLIDADKLECVYAILPQDASEDYKEGYGDGMKHVLEIVDGLPTITIPQWIPVSERLPEGDADVLISYRYKEGEGDTSHVYIDITSY